MNAISVRLLSAYTATAVLALTLISTAPAEAAAFTAGNLVIYRVGSGTGSLVNTGNPVFLDEYTPAGTLVQSIPLPTTTVGANRRLIASGTATSEGLISRSADGGYIVLTGYDAAIPTVGLVATSAATTPRIVGRAGVDGSLDTSTALTDYADTGNPRSAASSNGTDLWVTGSGGGIRYAPLAAATSTQLSTTVTNLRQTAIFDGQLYVTTSSGAVRLGMVGTGTPTTSGQTISNLPGFPTTGSPYGFFFADLDAGVAGNDTVYVADDTASQVQKYCLVAGVWAAKGTATAAAVRGLTGVVTGTTVTLYMTTGGSAAAGGGTLWTLADSSGFNGTLGGTPGVLATAATNTAFRGIALAPAQRTLTISDVTEDEGDSGTTAFTFTVTLSQPAGVGGVSFDIATAADTATAGSDYTTLSVTSQTIAEGNTTKTFDVQVNGDTDVEPDETFFLNVSNVTGAFVGDAQGLGTITNDDIAPAGLTIDDVSAAEADSGTTTFQFTVTVDPPAGAGGVNFDIATADGTATAGSDYVLRTLTSQSIPQGNTTYTFDVTVNGDEAIEPDETFFVNLTNVTGATVGDGQGLGTIQNDDVAPDLAIDNVTLDEGDSGTTTFTFTVSLSGPAPAGGATFDIATANGTATEPGDYAQKSLTSQSIPAGETEYTFDVLVNGDTTPETSETFFVNVTNATNATITDGQGLGTIANDELTKIHDVQGSGAATPIPGVVVTVEGVVIGDYQAGSGIQGFFLQEEDLDADANAATSEGIFVFCNTCATAVAEGQRVRATGAVSEFFGMTEITASTAGSVVVKDEDDNLAEVTSAAIDLPVVGVINDFYEPREGMLVTFVDSLAVSEYFELFRFGHIELFEGGRPRQFTEQAPPSAAGLAAHLDNLDRRRVIVDDVDNGANAPLNLTEGQQFVYHPHANGGFSVGTQGTDFFRGGDLVHGLTGVLHWSFAGSGSADAWRVRPTVTTPATFTVANPRPLTPPAVGGAIRAAGMNLLNYFTTIDTTSSTSSGPCGPSGTLDCRGADSAAELNRQRERASIVICGLDADVFGFMELENTATTTINDLLGAVNTRCGGTQPYLFVNTGGTLGTDAIRVALVYRQNVLAPVGSALVDLDPVHNRPPTAQTFDVVDATNPAVGQRFTVIANHFKSKGCPGTGGDADSGDGQSCFNATRVAQANRLLDWTTDTVIPAAGDADVLLLGDFNANAQEDPIAAIAAGGYTDLESALLGAAAYSYLFDGQIGHLDYAFSSSSLTPRVAGVGPWHINADEVPLFDYNDEVRDSPGEAAFEEKPDGSALVPARTVFEAASLWRASDHDPVLVGLFPVADLAITKTDGVTTAVPGGSVTYTITASNGGPDNAAAATTVSDDFPPELTCTWTCVGAGGGECSASGSGDFDDEVNLPAGGSVTYTASCAISSSATGTLSNTATVAASVNVIDPASGNDSATDNDTLSLSADLSITKTDGVTTAVPGGSVTYTLTASSAGPSDAVDATVADDFPASLTCTWTCEGAGGGDCTAAGNGDLNDTVNLPSGGSVTYTAGCTISAAATGSLSNTATVSAPGGVTDADPDDNSATDIDTLAPQANLSITKTDGVLAVEPGGSTTYTVVAANAGPSHAPGSTVTDDLPSALTCTWTCAEANGGDCTASGSGDISDTVNLPSGGSVTYTVSCTISAGATGTIANTATVATGAGVTDSTLGNNSAIDVDTLPTIFADGFESGDTSRWSNEVPGGFAVAQELELSGAAIEFAYDLARLPANVAFGPVAIAEVVNERGGVAFAVEARRSEATAPLELRLVAADGSGLRRTSWLAVAESTQALLLDWQENPPGGLLGRVSLGLDGRSAFQLDGFATASTPPSLLRLLLPE